jgi:hypothetical protein
MMRPLDLIALSSIVVGFSECVTDERMDRQTQPFIMMLGASKNKKLIIKRDLKPHWSVVSNCLK